MDFSSGTDNLEAGLDNDLNKILSQVNEIDNIFSERLREEEGFYVDQSLSLDQNEKINFNESFGPRLAKQSSPNVREQIEQVIFCPEEEDSQASRVEEKSVIRIQAKRSLQGEKRVPGSSDFGQFVKLKTVKNEFTGAEDDNEEEEEVPKGAENPLADLRPPNVRKHTWNSKSLVRSRMSGNKLGEKTFVRMRTNRSVGQEKLLQSNIINLKENLMSLIKLKKNKSKKKGNSKIKGLKKKLVDCKKENEKLRSELRDKERLEQKIKLLQRRLESRSDFSLSSLNKSRKRVNATDESTHTFIESQSTVKPMNYSFTRDDRETEDNEDRPNEPNTEYNIELRHKDSFKKKTNTLEEEEELVGVDARQSREEAELRNRPEKSQNPRSGEKPKRRFDKLTRNIGEALKQSEEKTKKQGQDKQPRTTGKGSLRQFLLKNTRLDRSLETFEDKQGAKGSLRDFLNFRNSRVEQADESLKTMDSKETEKIRPGQRIEKKSEMNMAQNKMAKEFSERFGFAGKEFKEDRKSNY